MSGEKFSDIISVLFYLRKLKTTCTKCAMGHGGRFYKNFTSYIFIHN